MRIVTLPQPPRPGTLRSSGHCPATGASGVGPDDASVGVGVGLAVSWAGWIVGRVSRRDSPCHRPDLVVAVSSVCGILDSITHPQAVEVLLDLCGG